MNVDWVPYSATSLVAGSTALVVGSILVPAEMDDGDQLQVVMQQDARWLAVAAFYFVAAVALTIGLPALLTLIDQRATRMGLLGAGVFVVGCLGTAGYAMLLVLVRAQVKTGVIEEGGLSKVADDAGLGVFLYGWIAAFYLGELMLAVALLRSRTVPRWMPLMLLAHVGALPLAAVLPQQMSAVTVLLSTVGFAGLGIAANNRQSVVQSPAALRSVLPAVP